MDRSDEIRNDKSKHDRFSRLRASEATGTALCAMSALFYSLASICLRRMSELTYDQAFQIAIKETVTVLIIAPWLIPRIARRKPLGTTWKLFGVMLFAGVVTQLLGNLGQIHSLGTIGLTLTAPAIFAVMLISGAILGHLLLGEKITLRSAAAIGVLIAAIVLLQQTARAKEASADGFSSFGLGAAATAGFTFAILAVSIRYVTNRGMHPGVVMIMTTGLGTICLGALGGYRSGFETLAGISWEHWLIMLAAGVFNFLGFFCLTIGLSMTRVTRANILNASQVAITASAGVLLFQEPFNMFLACGIVLTILGISMIGRSEPEEAPL